MNVVIVGLSAAGLSCLDTLLRFSPDTSITAISEEKYPPYCRCLLTYYLGRMLKEEQMVIKDISSYPANVRFFSGERAERIDTGRKSLILSSGKEIAYDKLLIATGAHAEKPKYYDEDKKTFTLRFMDDAKKVQQHIKDKAIVLGGGFVGIKAAYGLVERSTRVAMVIASAYPLSMIADEKTGWVVKKDLKAMGIDIYTGEDIAGIKMKNDSLRVSLMSGSELDSDVIVVGKGVKPRIDLARKSGIRTDRGVVVNEFLETSAEGVYAAGDCCETLDIARKTSWVNALWPVAVEQGYFAGLNISGVRSHYPGSIGMNSLKTHSFHLITAGVLKGGDDITFFEKYFPSTSQFRKLAVRDNIPVGMAFYNNSEDAGVIINLIKKGMPLTVDPARIVRNEVSMMDILKPL